MLPSRMRSLRASSRSGRSTISLPNGRSKGADAEGRRSRSTIVELVDVAGAGTGGARDNHNMEVSSAQQEMLTGRIDLMPAS